jgi:hypothetical protein
LTLNPGFPSYWFAGASWQKRHDSDEQVYIFFMCISHLDASGRGGVFDGINREFVFALQKWQRTGIISSGEYG